MNGYDPLGNEAEYCKSNKLLWEEIYLLKRELLCITFLLLPLC